MAKRKGNAEKPLTDQVEGEVEKILEGETRNGDGYLVVRICGQGYFDWHELSEKEGVHVGDCVRVDFEPGQWPRIQKIEKISEGENAGASGPGASALERAERREGRIVRLSCLRTAAELLSQSDLGYEDKKAEVLVLAEEMAAWVKAGESEE